MTVSLVNPELEKEQEVVLRFEELSPKQVSGMMLKGATIDTYNDFDAPDRVQTTHFTKARIPKQGIELKVPAQSILTLTIE